MPHAESRSVLTLASLLLLLRLARTGATGAGISRGTVHRASGNHQRPVTLYERRAAASGGGGGGGGGAPRPGGSKGAGGGEEGEEEEEEEEEERVYLRSREQQASDTNDRTPNDGHNGWVWELWFQKL